MLISAAPCHSDTVGGLEWSLGMAGTAAEPGDALLAATTGPPDEELDEAPRAAPLDAAVVVAGAEESLGGPSCPRSQAHARSGNARMQAGMSHLMMMLRRAAATPGANRDETDRLVS